MDLLREILHWTEELPLWQRDAVRRLLQQKDGLSSDDFTEQYSLLKAEHGLPNPRELKPIPLNAGHLPAAPQPGETIILKAIKNLKYVNRIAPNQRLNFAPSGMTVIYGGNASGKSDYTYVFKCACRQVRATFEAIDRKIPNRILQRNPNNLMWYDHAVTRTGGDS